MVSEKVDSLTIKSRICAALIQIKFLNKRLQKEEVADQKESPMILANLVLLLLFSSILNM